MDKIQKALIIGQHDHESGEMAMALIPGNFTIAVNFWGNDNFHAQKPIKEYVIVEVAIYDKDFNTLAKVDVIPQSDLTIKSFDGVFFGKQELILKEQICEVVAQTIANHIQNTPEVFFDMSENANVMWPRIFGDYIKDAAVNLKMVSVPRTPKTVQKPLPLTGESDEDDQNPLNKTGLNKPTE